VSTGEAKPQTESKITEIAFCYKSGEWIGIFH